MKKLYSPKEAQKEYFEGMITLHKLYVLIRKGEIPHFRLGGKIFLRKEMLESWISDQELKSLKKADTGDML